MHCPRCGQEQVANDLKFCSKCGLPMALVTEIVHHGGVLPELEQQQRQTGFITRSNGLKVSLVWFLVVVCLLVPLSALTGAEEGVAIIAIIGFVGSLIIAALSALFLKNPVVRQRIQPMALDREIGGEAADQKPALSEGQPTAAEDYVSPAGAWNAPDTGDLVKPGSVTEQTTRLLKKEE